MENSISATSNQFAARSDNVLKKKKEFHLVVLRSTVLPGTAETIVVPALEKSSGKRLGAGIRGLRESGVHAGRHSRSRFPRTGDTDARIAEPTHSRHFARGLSAGSRGECLKLRSAPLRW